jgi:preprotein translocase subunit SecG
MQSLALVIHVVLAVGVIGRVLIQHGKGADAGAAFGSGASATVFGASGSASFLTRATTLLAALFFCTSLFLFYLAANREGAVRSVTDTPGLVDQAPAVTTDLPGGVSGSDATLEPATESDMPTPVESKPAE